MAVRKREPLTLVRFEQAASDPPFLSPSLSLARASRSAVLEARQRQRYQDLVCEHHEHGARYLSEEREGRAD